MGQISIKHQAASGMVWTAVERFGSQIVQFIIGIVLARLLLPDDYGLIGMLAIFMAISQTFLDCGFANALIQKKDRDEIDYSTVFYFNLAVALILYGILFFFAPIIADFYNQPILTEITRVYSLTLIVNALSIVQTARLSIDLDFKLQAKASIISILISGTIGIVFAYNGFGVWALVSQGLLSASIRTMILWICGNWMPLAVFSKTSFRSLFSFGSKLLCSSLINTIYQNLSTIIIGKAFQTAELGYFTRANQFARLPSDSATAIIIKVAYPILSRLQDNDQNLVNAYTQLLRPPVFLLYPVLFLLIVLAHPLIECFIGTKWLPCVPLLQILSLGQLWAPLTNINLNLLYVKGRSDLVLKLEFIKKPIAFVLLLGAAFCNVYAVCVALAVYDFIAFAFNCHYTDKFFNFGFRSQFRQILPIIGYSLAMSVLVSSVYFITESPYLQLIAGTIIGIVSYIAMSILFHDRSFQELKIQLLNLIGK
ncbi:lipopolysaccharide biosynthesis protein [uncultured Duncaniella sp.]|uniref:lipopolysaccharide biosynthesis protein n=1 Tax=uncultured Duncaniella sp. TaxID=2768039 RepID=UPI00265A7D21|nr:lipopolysaccharide biosynthesis protein [uncultured Duncaniella sp.]